MSGSLIPYDWCLEKEGHMNYGDDWVVTLPQTKEHLGLSETERNKEGFSYSREFRGNVELSTPLIWTSNLTAMTE